MATPLTLPATGNARIERSGDKDVFAFHATVDHRYLARCTSTLCSLALIGPSGEQVATGRNDYASPISIHYRARVAGTYFLVVTGTEGSTLDYQYGLQDFGLDDHGDGYATATPIAPGSTTAGDLDMPGDADAFRWPAERRRIYRVTLGNDFGVANLLLSVRTATRELLTVWPDQFTTERHSTAFFAAPASEDLMVQVWGRYGFSSGGEYSVRVDALGLDDHGGPGQPTDLQVPTAPTRAAIDYPGDVDLFRFSAEVGHTYRIRCVPGTLAGCPVTLWGGTGMTVASARGEVQYTAPEAGTYTVLMSGEGEADEGTYAYSLEDVSTSDPGNDTPALTGK